MDTLATVSFTLGVILYSVASTLFFLVLARSSPPPVAAYGGRVLAVGAAFHFAHIVVVSLITRVCPVVSVHFALSLSAFVAVIVFLWVGRRRRLDALGILVAPLGLTFLVFAQFIDPRGANPEVSRALLSAHVLSNLLGLGLVQMAGAASAFYVFTERKLKAKRLTGVGRLPSLETLDRLSHRLLLIAFPLLTFGSATGAMFFAQMNLESITSLVRAGLGYGTWLVVLFVLISRQLWGFRGRRAAYGTLLGAVTVTLVLLVYVFRPLLGGG